MSACLSVCLSVCLSATTALRQAVNDGDVVVDVGTGPFAILASQAAQAGAERVFAVEANRDAAKAALEFLNESSDPKIRKIEIIEGIGVAVVVAVVVVVVLPASFSTNPPTQRFAR